MRSQNHQIILFIDRLGFSVYQDTLTNIPKFNFTPDIVVNLDVVNKEQFVSLIEAFIQVNKILPSSLVIILPDSVIYVKDLVNPLQNGDIQNFLGNIPFEEVLAKVIKTSNGDRIVGVNKDLVMIIADAFASKGSVLEAIIPSFLYGPNVNFTQGLTQDNLRVILAESEIVRIGNLLTDQQRLSPLVNSEIEQKTQKKPQNLRQYILIGVFAALLVILAIVYLISQVSSDKEAESSSAGAISFPTIIPTLAQASVTTIPFDLKNIKITIVQNSESGSIGETLKQELLKIGFENIANENSETTVPAKSSIIFSPSVSLDARTSALLEVRKMLPDIFVLENQDADQVITILIGKS